MTANGVAAWKDLDGDGVATATLNSSGGGSVSGESDVPGLVADLALKAPLASPTFTGAPVLPTGTTGTTQSAADGSTKLATTAYVDTADALKANLTSPTFTGTPSMPTGTTGTTQSAADSSTKLATTAFVTTADNLKANLAGPTFTGTVTLPSTTVAVTASASDNSTKPATTAYVDTADALKANLASPTFTGTPSLPTGTTATTQTAADSTTKLATTAFATTADNLRLLNTVTVPVSLGANTYANFWPNLATAANAISGSAGNARFVRVVMPATGTLHDVSFGYDATSTGNFNILVLDDGQANATHTTRTCLYIKGATAATGALTWATGDANLAVTIGDTLVFAITSSETTSTIAMTNGKGPISLTTSFFPGSGASTASQRVAGTIASANVPGSVNATVTDANLTNTAACALVTWRIT